MEMETFQPQPLKPKSFQPLADKFMALFIPFLIFLTPLFFLSLTPNFFEFNKMFLVLGGSLLIFAILLAKALIDKKIVIYCTPLDLPIILVLASLIASTIFASPNRVLPFLGKTGIIFSLTCFYFALTQSRSTPGVDKETPAVGVAGRKWLQALIASSFVLSWITIFTYVQALPKVLPWDFVKNQAFNPAGSLTALVLFQIILLPPILLFGGKSNQFLNKILYFLVAALGGVSIVLAVSLILPGKPATPIFLPYQIGWWIAVEIFKEAKTAFLGLGPEGFLSAFTRFRPAIFNNLAIWTLRFTTSSNEILQVLTTTGLFGLVTLVYLLFTSGKKLFKDLKRDDFNLSLKIAFSLIILLFLALPANFLTLFVLYILLAQIASQLSTKKVIHLNQPAKATCGFALGLIVILVYFAGRGWLAEARFKNALDAAAANRGLETYNKQVEAIQLNPFQEKYRVSYSQVNLALANSLAGKTDLTDQDRQNITQLVSQAIAEAKAAAVLNPTNSVYWENLAGLYRTLINFATGADNWATAAYIQAIRLDPVNPLLRVDLGGLFYALGNYESAIDQFKRAIDLKPDYANAYYNLAWAYQQKGEPRQAFLAMQRVTALVPQDTDDFIKAAQELEQLRALLPEEEKLATAAAARREEILTPPPALPSPPPAAPIILPEESGPEMPSSEPSPSPGEEVSTSPSPISSPTP